jgi:uncharacterized protein with von Willebrand factor type A (vWA) domain
VIAVVSQELDLPKNIVLFSKILRNRKVGVTTDNVIDALKGITFIDIQQKGDFYHLLRSNFVSRKEEIQPFNDAFDQFWPPATAQGSSDEKEIKKAGASRSVHDVSSALTDQEKQVLNEDVTVVEDKEGEEERLFALYSPHETFKQKDFGQYRWEDAQEIRELVLSLSQKMASNLLRRWKQGKKGDRIDFRKTFRNSIKYGGEIVELRMREQKPGPLRIILLCDVSGSMDVHTQFFLLFIYGLQNHYPYCETFVFTTRLSHISFLLKRRSFDEALRLLSAKVLDWSGGTNIGGSLRQLRHGYAHLLHPDRTLFLIFSDGWDRGDSTILNQELSHLKRQVKRLIWLNPLLGSPDYQPLCKGMATALPYLDHFLPCRKPADLRRLKIDF